MNKDIVPNGEKLIYNRIIIKPFLISFTLRTASSFSEIWRPFEKQVYCLFSGIQALRTAGQIKLRELRLAFRGL
jgi:hypothetical protein